MEPPLVSVCVQTYQHVNYIKECLDGILMQQTNFPFEIILGEDASDDGTREICVEYAEKYPDIIKLFLRSRKNVIYINGKPTGRFNVIENLKACQGNYIAICEGDDYWTDPFKLQKQVDFLESNSECVISVHNSSVINHDGSFNRLFNGNPIPTITDAHYILSHPWYIPTASMVFRKESLILPKWFSKGLNGDYMLQLILTSNGGYVHYKDEVMSCYRCHDQGISNIFNQTKVFNHSMIYINAKFDRFSKGKYAKEIRENIWKHSFQMLYHLPIKSKEFWRVAFNLIWINKGLTSKQLEILFDKKLKKRIPSM